MPWECKRVALSALCAAALASCGDDAPEIPPMPQAACRADAEMAQIWGPWQLDFHGTREACANERWNGAFEIRPTLEFEVAQRDDAGTPGRARLRLARSVDGFRFDGSVEGDCVRFALIEDKQGGTALAFAGAASEGEIAGRFEGTGPGSCANVGTFEARFRPLPGR